MDCIFCKIAAGEIPAKTLYQDEQIVAFCDTDPKAPVHLLVIPREHLQSLAHTAREHTGVLGHLMATAADLARSQGLTNGYRIVVNSGPDGGQTVDHLHVHVLGGRQLHWPPG